MVRILCIHGIGHGDIDRAQQEGWRSAITQAIQRWDPRAASQIDFVLYDDLFANVRINAVTIAKALAKLLAGGVSSAASDVEDWVSGLFPQVRAFGGLSEEVRWTAGMVVQWVEDDQLKADARGRVLDYMDRFKPDVICAHSLGSLIAYDTFARTENSDKIQDKWFVTLGSQIGNPFVRGSAFAGRITDLQAKEWYHLYNSEDRVFTAPLTIEGDNFEQVTATFDNHDFLNHAAVRYLSNDNVLNQVWRPIAGAPTPRALTQSARAFARLADPPSHRALLVGINDYPNPKDRLAGCENDVFLMSEVLQECGFEAEDIRVVFNERATAAGILERVKWLLDGAGPGDQRFFFYSGHGAQLPLYGADGKVQRIDSCLVPYDFDWKRESAITDGHFMDLYSQLPYEAHFMIVLDCCYSGGMTRQGGIRVRGLDPPDDIRHRMLRWDARHEMWVPRKLQPQNPDLAAGRDRLAYLGESGATRRLGRAVALRTASNEQYDKLRDELGHKGPFHPMVYEACKEDEYSYEYHHGVTSYGAFTYSLGRIFRHYRTQGKALTFAKLLAEAKKTLKDLDYKQTPVLSGPKGVVDQVIPWQAAKKAE
jgi:metacaspase-1